MVFWIFISLLAIQRVIELMIAKRNEKSIIKQGGYEVGHSHYKYMVLMHVMFFVSFLYEVSYFDKELSTMYRILLPFFLLTQVGRVWVIYSLGMFWNTKIMILPASQIRVKGPYKYLKHPNYLIVSIELIILPLFFSAYFTAIVFSLLNIMILSIRIPIEEWALQVHAEYQHIGSNPLRAMRALKKD
ncbi:isoprenylcysteine carboxyl methyltransferase family protein [Fredinandcohnia humi]